MELIEELPEGEEISLYRQGEFVDLCAGPHVSNTSVVKAFKLQSVAGAYWHGDEHNQMLTRIYGTSFPKAAELDEYLKRMEEAKRETTESLEKSLDCLPSWRRVRDFHSSFRKEWFLKTF